MDSRPQNAGVDTYALDVGHQVSDRCDGKWQRKPPRLVVRRRETQARTTGRPVPSDGRARNSHDTNASPSEAWSELTRLPLYTDTQADTAYRSKAAGPKHLQSSPLGPPGLCIAWTLSHYRHVAARKRKAYTQPRHGVGAYTDWFNRIG